MRPFRALSLILLVVALLPWGAYVHGAARFAGLVAVPVAVSAAASVAEGPQDGAAVAAEARKAGPVLAAAERPCRKGTLPGSPCGPDLGLLPPSAAAAGRLAGRGGPPEAGRVPAGWSRAPPAEPPRVA